MADTVYITYENKYHGRGRTIPGNFLPGATGENRTRTEKNSIRTASPPCQRYPAKMSAYISVSKGIRALNTCSVMKCIQGLPVTTVKVAFPMPTSTCVMMM